VSSIVDEIGRKYMKRQADAGFRVGDTVDVHVRIKEGDKERIQVFTGTVIGRSGGGVNETFTVRRIVQGEGVERVFMLHSPLIDKIEVRKTGKARRAKLGYLRDRSGRSTRLAERREEAGETNEPAASASAGEPPPAATPGGEGR